MKQERRHGRRLLEIGKDILIAVLVLVNVTLAIMCLPTKTLTQTKWLASALRPFAGLFGINEAELTYVEAAVPAPSAAKPLAISVQNVTGRCSAVYDEAALELMYEPLGALLAQALPVDFPVIRPRPQANVAELPQTDAAAHKVLVGVQDQVQQVLVGRHGEKAVGFDGFESGKEVVQLVVGVLRRIE